MRLYDAHNHLQDHRLSQGREGIFETLEAAGIIRMVVNGTRELDWPEVLELAKHDSRVIASFGYHPWHVHERSAAWQHALVQFLDAVPSAVGEIGLDRWILERNGGKSDRASLSEQEDAFVWQLRHAAERNLPVSIHCLKAWGTMLNILRREPRPQCGFVFHSYGGPVEMIAPLAALGACFSMPGNFANESRQRQRETFRHVPRERLLIETDAPYQLPPDALNRHPLTDARTGEALNHPANLPAVYEFAAGWLGEPVERLAAQVEENFLRLFGAITAKNFPEQNRR